MTKIVIKSVFGKVLYKVKGEKITIKDAVEDAVFAGINLSYANLRDAKLREANLSITIYTIATIYAHKHFNECERQKITAYVQYKLAKQEERGAQ